MQTEDVHRPTQFLQDFERNRMKKLKLL